MTDPSLRRQAVEVLAPAGDSDALDAALAAGADAVYLGVAGFNTRARASNFPIDGLGTVMARLHAAGARGYVTLNTLVFDAERPAVGDIILACVDAGVDALIVQDLGVARWARELAPAMPLHASTQMTCTDTAAIELAASLGISRVVLPRELSVAEVARVGASTDVELEVFVHGALCVSFSGQCLASLSMGGRSANRGMCAQPCRLPYTLVADGHARRHGYLLSPTDLDAAEWIPKLLDAGVHSLKIEGRLKGPAYVGAAVRLVRGVVEDWARGDVGSPDPLVREAALQMFSRGSGPGFLGGVDHARLVDVRSSDHRGLLLGKVEGVQHIGGKAHLVVCAETGLACGDGILVEAREGEPELGGRVWALRSGGQPVEAVEVGTKAAVWLGPDRHLADSLTGGRVFRTSAPRLESQVQRWLAEGRPRVSIRVEVQGRVGEPARFRALAADGRTVEVSSSVAVQRAERRPLTHETVAEKMGRLGDTRYELQALELQLPGDAMLPLSSLNDARRRLVERLDALLVPTRRIAVPSEHPGPLELPEPPEPQAIVLCRRAHQIQAAVDGGARWIVLDLPDARAIRRACEALRSKRNDRVWVVVPTLRIRKPGEAVLDESLLDLEPDAVLVRSLAALHDQGARQPRRFAIADASLNVANSTAARVVLSAGADAFTPSWDLSPDAVDGWFEHGLMPFAEVLRTGPGRCSTPSIACTQPTCRPLRTARPATVPASTSR